MKVIDQLPAVSAEMRRHACELRNNMTEAEVYLWSKIKSKKLGIRFLRQRVIGTYICDFVSLDAGIVIEIDGSQHYEDEGKEYDRKRDNYLKSFGFKVLRFSNIDVLKNIEGVVSVIAGVIGSG